MKDLISRQAAIDALNKMKIYRPLDSDRYVISDCLNKIVNLPSVQPTQNNTSNALKSLDCIDRKAAIDAINHICQVDTEYDCTLLDRVDVRYVLSDLPSVQPEHTETHSCENKRTETHEWIPVSEALPNDGVEVWVTIKGHDVIRREEGKTLEQAIDRINKIRWVTRGYWSDEEHAWNDPSFAFPLMVQPIAWMPINKPEPWRGGQDETN